MTEVLKKVVGSKKQKALSYSGTYHSFTKRPQPPYDFKGMVLKGYTSPRFGDIIYTKKQFNILNVFLCSPWTSTKFWTIKSLPVDGRIDRALVMLIRKLNGLGVDLLELPIENCVLTFPITPKGVPN